MRTKRRMAGIIAVVGALLLVAAPPANAASQTLCYQNCTATISNYQDSYALTSGACTSKAARHQYMTSGNLHWTYWESSVNGKSPTTPGAPLTKSEHRFTADGSGRQFPLGA